MRDMEEIVGYGFHPTNEQLVGNYLRKKRLDPDYSHPKIREVNIYDFEPSELPGLALVKPDATEWYFFVALRYMNTKRKLVKRKTRGGTWKPTGKKPDVKRSKEVIGSKSKLVFYQGPSTRNKNVKTNWVMDEFHCKPDPLFKADFVVVRIKIKPNDSCDSSTTSESVTSHHLTSDSRDHIAEVTQVESQQLQNNYMSCNNEDYSADTIFSKEFQPLQNHDISPNGISQSLSNRDISPNIISQPLSHHHISLNRVPDLLPNHDISSNGESLTLSNHNLSFNRENQPLPNNDLPFNIESQQLPLHSIPFNIESLPLHSIPFNIESLLVPNYNLCSILPHHDTSFNREVQPQSNYNLSSILPHHEISSNRGFQQLPNYNISSNRESQPPNYDISLNGEYQPLPHDISSNRESHVVPNYNLSSILPHHDISSNRESHLLLNHSLYPNIEDLDTKNTSSEVEPLVPAVWDSVIDCNGQDHYSFSTQQTQIHLLQQQQVWDSLIDCNGLDQNTFSAQQTQIHLQQGSSHSCDFSNDSNVLNTPFAGEQENNWSNLQRDVQDEFSEKETGHSHTPDFYSTKPVTGAAYAYSSSDESALLNGDSSVSNSPLGSEQENNRSNSQSGVWDEFYPPIFDLSMPVTEAHACGGTGAHGYSGSDKTIDAILIGDDVLLYGYSPVTYGEYGFNSMCQPQSYLAIDENILPQHMGNAV